MRNALCDGAVAWWNADQLPDYPAEHSTDGEHRQNAGGWDACQTQKEGAPDALARVGKAESQPLRYRSDATDTRRGIRDRHQA